MIIDPDKMAGYSLAIIESSSFNGLKLREILSDEASEGVTRGSLSLSAGIAITSATTAALACEIILKAWIAKTSGEYPHGHNLEKLKGKVDKSVWKLFREEERAIIFDSIKRHQNDFVDWRYLFEKWEKDSEKETPDDRMIWSINKLIEKYIEQLKEKRK